MNIRKPDLNLNLGKGSHGHQTGHMIIEIEKICIDKQPHMIIIFGVTNPLIKIDKKNQ